MEESIKDTLSPGVFRGFFPIEKKDGISALGLAYIGDAVFELMVRLYMAGHGSMRVEKLHKRVTETVNAASQSRLSYILLPELTEEEEEVFRRGRNQKSQTAARHQSITDYRRATGLEALFGWLYIEGRYERLRELFIKGMEGLEKGIDQEPGLRTEDADRGSDKEEDI